VKLSKLVLSRISSYIFHSPRYISTPYRPCVRCGSDSKVVGLTHLTAYDLSNVYAKKYKNQPMYNAKLSQAKVVSFYDIVR